MEEGVACDCGRERRIFKGRIRWEQFGAYLFAGRLKGGICIAHNSSGYDSHFVLDFVHRKVIKPSVITTGHKILRLEAEGVTFIDSLNFFPMALIQVARGFWAGRAEQRVLPPSLEHARKSKLRGRGTRRVVLRP